MLLASVGMFRYRRWGWWLALRMFAANGLADIAQVFMGRVLEGAIGVTVANIADERVYNRGLRERPAGSYVGESAIE